MPISDNNQYYQEVKTYYNEDSTNFEDRYWVNETLQKIRHSFREETEGLAFENALEIGYGPGVDVVYFAKKYPNKSIKGIDISDGMYDNAEANRKKDGLNNLELAVGAVEDISTAFPDQKFDLIYVYFGALNTVEDLKQTAQLLEKSLSPSGKMVLTFVNKWYMMSILKPLVKLKFKTATRRLGKVWGGYSPKKFLASKCYSSRSIANAFSNFNITYRRGYSILFPAWYENEKFKSKKELTEKLWRWDQVLQKTPCWNWGEYSLYIFEQKP